MSPGPRTSLGVDFGTSHTIAVVRRADGSVRPLLFDGAPLMPSAVCADTEGGLLVGRDAVHAGRRHPERFEPNPKRLIDRPSTLLGDREYPVPDLIAAVLDAVADECRRVVGRPAQVTLTVPAEWGPARRQVVEDAAARSGLGRVRLVPEPVAAATYYAEALKHHMPVGSSIVVYDLGAGTFDASVVRRSGDGFETVALDGRGDLGGLDIDAALIEHLGATYGSRDGWKRLTDPTTIEERRFFREFRDEVRAAKERLSRHQQADIAIPLLDVEAHLTRTELEQIAEPHLEQTIRVTKAVIRAAGLEAAASAGVFLVGGASRMPLVATLLHRSLGVAPIVLDQPEVVVAEGSVLWTQSSPPGFPLQTPQHGAYGGPITPAAPAGPVPNTPQRGLANPAPYTEPVAPPQHAPTPLFPTPSPETRPATVAAATPPAPDRQTLPPQANPHQTPVQPAARQQDPPVAEPKSEADRLRARKTGRRVIIGFILVDILIIAGLVWYFGRGAEADDMAFEPAWGDLAEAGAAAGELVGAHDDAIASLATMDTDAGPMVFSAGADGLVRQWSMTAGDLVDEYEFPQGLNTLWTATGADGADIMVAVDRDYRAHVWTAETGAFTAAGRPALAAQDDVQYLRTGTREGHPVLALLTDTHMEVYDLHTRSSLGVAAIPAGADWPRFYADEEERYTDLVYAAAEYPLGRANTETGEPWGPIEDYGAWTDLDQPNGLSVVYDDTVPYAMLYSTTGYVYFWNLLTGEPSFTPTPYGEVTDEYHHELIPTEFGPALMHIDGEGGAHVTGVEGAGGLEFPGGDNAEVTETELFTVDGHPVAVTGDDNGNIRFWSLGL
ncbi:Hsp70 family protein [Glycomyces sp. NRRL B-16210]|uniref:Hsp70 family protein n=1 Tax=Glycomyces sp. NRRL B-16210 TaxID=1463821 RepID=UPI0006923B1C|nr:Hsp70 family protein [Glycomyces sp. NRRL B-16210]